MASLRTISANLFATSLVFLLCAVSSKLPSEIRRPLPWPRQGRRLGPPQVWNLSFLATGIPRPHQWLLLGVQACRLPGLKRLKGFPYNFAKASRSAQPRRQKLPQGHIHRFFWAVQPAIRQASHASNPSNASTFSWHA